MKRWVRGMIAGIGLGLAAQSAGCGAAPGYEEETTPTPAAELRPLEIAQHDARLRGIEGAQAVIDVQVTLRNPNDAEVVLRRATGELVVGEHRLATLELDGEEPLAPSSERPFVFELVVPLSMLAGLSADHYVARGTLFADGGTGDGSLQTPFELTGSVPALAMR